MVKLLYKILNIFCAFCALLCKCVNTEMYAKNAVYYSHAQKSPKIDCGAMNTPALNVLHLWKNVDLGHGYGQLTCPTYSIITLEFSIEVTSIAVNVHICTYILYL